MSKQVIKNYTFNASTRKITLTDFTSLRLDRLYLITDTTAALNGIILYNFGDTTSASATIAGNVITLSSVPGSASNSDSLQIIYDCVASDPQYDAQPVENAVIEEFQDIDRQTIKVTSPTFVDAFQAAGAIATNTVIQPIRDIGDMTWMSITFNTGGGWVASIKIQQTNDQGIFVDSDIYNFANINQPPVQAVTANGQYFVRKTGRYMKMFYGSYTSGAAATGTVQYFTTSCPIAPLFATPDVRPASGTITTLDIGSSTATGQDSTSIVTGTPTAASFFSQAINGISSFRAQLTGTWTGTITFEISEDGGTTWVSTTTLVGGTGNTRSAATGNGIFLGDVSAATNVRARATAAMTGTATVNFTFAANTGVVKVANPLRLIDNTSNAQLAIKAASTAALTTDPSAVVAISPNSNTVTIGSMPLPTGASTAAKQPALGTAGTASSDVITVQGIASMTPLKVDGSATIQPVSGTVSLSGNPAVTGPTASGSSLTAAPVTSGGLAKTTNPTAVSDGQVVNSTHDKVGRQITVLNAPRDLVARPAQLTLTNTTETTLITAIASTFCDITKLICVNTSTSAVRVDIRDVTGGSVVESFMIPPTDMRGCAYTVPLKQTTVNTAWTAQLSTSVTDVRITAQYVQNI